MAVKRITIGNTAASTAARVAAADARLVEIADRMQTISTTNITNVAQANTAIHALATDLRSIVLLLRKIVRNLA